MSYLAFYFDQMSYLTICRIDELSYSTNCRVDEMVFDEMSWERVTILNTLTSDMTEVYGKLEYFCGNTFAS